MRGVIVEVAARRFAIPQECPCCGAPPNAELPIAAAASGQTLLFPYCTKCIGHITAWETANVASTGVMVLGIIVAIIVALAISVPIAAGVFVVAATLAWIVRVSRRKAASAQRRDSCATTSLAVGSRGWENNTNAFTFESPTFAARFAEQNSAILANETPQLRKLVDGYRKARLAVPTPAVAVGVAPPPLTSRDWLARLEATTGTVARRVQLGRALDMVEEAHLRRELIQAVARLELAPLLDKLRQLSSPDSQRRLLESLIEQIRADNIAEELQTAELEQLTARLGELQR